MFNFLKKKEKSFEAPPRPEGSNAYAPVQKTKVEDDVASFEVPDFSEDDLNFDLGLGEFMPTNSNFIEPKGLSTESNVPLESESNQGIKPNIDSNTLNTPSNFNDYENSNLPNLPKIESTKPAEIKNEEAPVIQAANNLDNSFNNVQENAFEISNNKKDSQKQELGTKSDFIVNNNFSWGTESKIKESKENILVEESKEDLKSNDNEELPKFNTQGDINFYTNSIIQEKIKKPSLKSQVQLKSKQKKQPTEIEPIQSSKEGLFLPKQVLQKMIILADDTTRKTASAESLKAGFVTISSTQDSSVDDLTRTMKSIRDSLMITDAKLFGRGEE